MTLFESFSFFFSTILLYNIIAFFFSSILFACFYSLSLSPDEATKMQLKRVKGMSFVCLRQLFSTASSSPPFPSSLGLSLTLIALTPTWPFQPFDVCMSQFFVFPNFHYHAHFLSLFLVTSASTLSPTSYFYFSYIF